MRLIVGFVLLLAATVNPLGTKKLNLRADSYVCARRTIHDHFNNHGYLFTFEDPKTSKLELNWPEAREFCRARCMELVSLETKEENEFVKQHIAKGRVRYVWTSGHKCNFAGCDRHDLKPINVYGWFWTGSLKKMPPTTNRIDSDWSDYGGIGRPQPDNRESVQGGPEEDCMAILNNFYDDGIKWHDIACHHRLPFICEDSDALLHAAHISDQYSMYSDSMTTTREIEIKQKHELSQKNNSHAGFNFDGGFNRGAVESGSAKNYTIREKRSPSSLTEVKVNPDIEIDLETKPTDFMDDQNIDRMSEEVLTNINKYFHGI